MFANAFQSSFLTLFYSIGSNPLNIWDKTVKNGHIRRIVDEEVKSLVLEITGTNVATTYITCPIKPRASLGVRLPFLVMVVKNLKKYFTFEIQVLDDKDMRRRFRVSNFQSTTKVRPFCTTMPIGLSSGWNQIQFNLADFTKRAYGTTYVETVRVQIHANVRLRRIYFSSRLYSEDELPNEYKMFLPTGMSKKQDPKQSAAGKKDSKQVPVAAPPSSNEEREEDQAQPSPVEPSEPPPATEITAGDATEQAEGEKIEEVVATAVPVEGGEGEMEAAPAEAAATAEEAPAEAPPAEAGGEGEEAPAAPPAEAEAAPPAEEAAPAEEPAAEAAPAE